MSAVVTPRAAEAQLDQIGRQLAELTAEVRRQAARQEVVADLLSDASPIVGEVMQRMTVALADVDVPAYRDFAVGGAAVVDRVVTSFGPEDLEALGDNVVLILETLKEMTQPEVMTMLRRTAHLVSEADDPAEPPSVLSLVRELRDPDVRRGLGRLLAVLRSVGTDDPGAPPAPPA